MGILDVPSYSKAQSDARYPNINKAIRGRYTLPVRNAFTGLNTLQVMSNPPAISQTNSVVYYLSSTSATSNGTSITYNTPFNSNSFVPNQTTVTVTGYTNSAYNITGALVTAATTTSFTVNVPIASGSATNQTNGRVYVQGTIPGGAFVFAGSRSSMTGSTDPTKSQNFRYFGNTVISESATGSNTSNRQSMYVSGTLVADAGDAGGAYYVEFDYDGSAFELITYGSGYSGIVLVDGQLTESAKRSFGSNDSYIYFTKYDFGSRALRRIVVCFYGVDFLGVVREGTASVYQTPPKSLKVLWQGDSITAGANCTVKGVYNYSAIASNLLGFDEPINVSQGGTGFLNPGQGTNGTSADLSSNVSATDTSIPITGGNLSTSYPFNAWLGAERITVTGKVGNSLTVVRGISYLNMPTVAEPHYIGDSVITGNKQMFRAQNFTTLARLTVTPDVVVISGGHNDAGYDQTQFAAEVLTYLRSIRTLYPNAILVVMSPIASGGPEVYTRNYLKMRDSLKVACADSQVNATFIDMLELALNYTPTTTTLSSAASSGATSISVNNAISVGSYVDIGDYSGSNTYGGRRLVTNISGSGPYTLTLSSGISASFTGTETVKEVGPGVFSGNVKWTNLKANSQKSVTGITLSGTTATVTSASHGFAAGDTVVIANTSGVAGLNKEWTIATVSTNSFTFATTLTGTVTLSSATATVYGVYLNGSSGFGKTSSSHGLVVGDTVAIVNTSGVSGLNAKFTVTAVPNTTSFVFSTSLTGNVTIDTGDPGSGVRKLYGTGNSDFAIADSDGVHPTNDGHRILAEEFVNQFIIKLVNTRL